MDRRSFLKTTGLAAGATAAGATLAAPAIGQDRQEWKMVTTWPKNFPGLGTGAQRLADRITALTDGRITVRLFAAGELVPPFESFDAVSSGTAELYHAAEYYWQGKHPSFNFFTTVPMGMLPAEQNAWLYYGGGQQLWNELSNGFGIQPFAVGNTGVQLAGWFREEITSLDDLQGLKFRTPGLGGEAMRQIGVNVVSLPGGEIFPALQSGAIDAAEWVGPWNDLAFGLYRVAKFYYYPGYQEPSATISCGINKALFDRQSKTDQEIIRTACAAANDELSAEFTANNGSALATLVNQHEVQVRKFPQDVIDALAVASEEVVANTANHNDLAKKIYDSYSKAQRELATWTEIADLSYAQERSRVLGIGNP